MPRVPIDIPFAEAGLKYLSKSTHCVSSTRWARVKGQTDDVFISYQ
jgi:hypothetical protein